MCFASGKLALLSPKLALKIFQKWPNLHWSLEKIWQACFEVYLDNTGMDLLTLKNSENYFSDRSLISLRRTHHDVEIFTDNSRRLEPIKTNRILLGAFSSNLAKYLKTRDDYDEVIKLYLPDFEPAEIENFLAQIEASLDSKNEVKLQVSTGSNF